MAKNRKKRKLPIQFNFQIVIENNMKIDTQMELVSSHNSYLKKILSGDLHGECKKLFTLYGFFEKL